MAGGLAAGAVGEAGLLVQVTMAGCAAASVAAGHSVVGPGELRRRQLRAVVP